MVGAVTGFSIGRLFMYLEKFVIYNKDNALSYSKTTNNMNSFFYGMTSQNVPLYLRLFIIVVGGYVLYKREIKKWKKQQDYVKSKSKIK